MAIIKYFLGAMYTKKSSSSIDFLLRSEYKHKIIVAPNAYKRGFVSREHNIKDLPADITIISHIQELSSDLSTKDIPRTLIMIDEVQFMNDLSFWLLLHYVHNTHMIDIIMAGLNYNQYGEPFDNHERLMSMIAPKSIHRLYIPCATCDSYLGEISVRKWQTEDRITDDYAVLCQECFYKFIQSHYVKTSCYLCDEASVSQKIRQWKSDNPNHDTTALLCETCYRNIKFYNGKRF